MLAAEFILATQKTGKGRSPGKVPIERTKGRPTRQAVKGLPPAVGVLVSWGARY